MATDTATMDQVETEDPETDGGFALQRPYNVPPDSRFENEEAIEAPDIEAIANELIAEYHVDFERHGEAKIEYLWKRKGGMQGGGALVGQTQRTPWIARFYSGSEFTMWIAADNARALQLDDAGMRALIFHLLLHIEYDGEKDKFKVRDHDFEGFVRELEVFGPWQRDLRRAQAAFSQSPLPLWETKASPAADGDDEDPDAHLDEVDAE
jgi:hypothetical protein